MPPECPDELQLQAANTLLELDSPLAAIRAFRKLEKTPLRLEAGLGLSVALAKAGRQMFSTRVLSALASEFPDDQRPLLRLASQEINRKNHRGAWRYLQTCLTYHPDCAEAWLKAYTCASQLKKDEVCEQIARKLISLAPASAEYHERLGVALIQLHRPLEACSAYQEAHKHAPEDIVYFLNSRLPFCSIPQGGLTPHIIASKILSTTTLIEQQTASGKTWNLRGDRSIGNAIFYTAYSPLNLRTIYEPYLAMLHKIANPLIRMCIDKSNEMSARLSPATRPQAAIPPTLHRRSHARIRLGFTSRFFCSHSNTQAFEGFLKYLDRDHFHVLLIHQCGTVTDDVHARVNGLADDVVYLTETVSHTHMTLSSLDLDILFFTDIGMDPLDFVIPDLRTCDIQITGWGLPHTTGLKSIDYYLSSKLLESQAHEDEYTEQLVLLDGLPCCFLSDNLHYQRQPKHYFLLPDDRVVIGCVQTLFKIHPDMDLIIERIAKQLPDAIFAFVTISDHLDSAFMARLEKRAPTAFQRTMLLNRCANTDFLALCDCLDIILDTPYYGAGVTAYMSTYVGTPMVCFSGSRLRDSTTAAIYRYLSITNAPIVNSIPEYVDKVVELANNFELRYQIKKDTVEAAHKLYDNQEYIRSFEKFCLQILGRSGKREFE